MSVEPLARDTRLDTTIERHFGYVEYVGHFRQINRHAPVNGSNLALTEEPAPNGTIGTCATAQTRTIAATSSFECG